MTTRPATAKKPQDRQKPKPDAHPDEPFEFTHDGATYTLAVATDVLTAGFARRTRHLDPVSQFFEMIEQLADDAALAAIDEMKRDEFEQFQRDFYAHTGVELGE